MAEQDEHIRAIARRAFQEPALRRLFPYSSLSNLRFSHVTEYPFDPMPRVAACHNPWGADFYQLRDLENRPLVAATSMSSCVPSSGFSRSDSGEGGEVPRGCEGGPWQPRATSSTNLPSALTELVATLLSGEARSRTQSRTSDGRVGNRRAQRAVPSRRDESMSSPGRTTSFDPHPGAPRCDGPECAVNASRGPPTLREGQCAIMCVERSTGIVLALSGEWATGGVEVLRVYPTAEEAEASASALVARHPPWEAIVHDWRGEVAAIYRGELPAPERPERWWRRWLRLLRA